MKEPRQILFERHRAAKTKLDAIRQTVLENLPDSRSRRREGEAVLNEHHRAVRLLTSAATRFLGARQLLRSFRWHLAGMSAAWVIIALLNTDHSAAPAPTLAKRNDSSPRQLLTALRENRRQLLEMIGAPVTEPVPSADTLVPRRRSELPSSTSMA